LVPVNDQAEYNDYIATRKAREEISMRQKMTGNTLADNTVIQAFSKFCCRRIINICNFTAVHQDLLAQGKLTLIVLRRACQQEREAGRHSRCKSFSANV